MEDSGGIEFNQRFKRQVNSSETDSVAPDDSDDDISVTTSGTSSSSSPPQHVEPENWFGQKGYISNQDLVNNVDIKEEKFNKTVNEESKNYSSNVSHRSTQVLFKITQYFILQDTFKYYKSHFEPNGQQYFIDLDQMNSSGKHAGNVQEHNMLSKSYRRAATIQLNFKFPFYGHEVSEY